MPSYTETTISSLIASLANALGDSDEAFFSPGELKRYIWEAMTVFQALSNYWRETAIFNPSENTRWIDLGEDATNLVNAAGDKVLQCQITDRGLVEFILESLIEDLPSDWTTWETTEQFSSTEIVAVFNRVYHKFFYEVGSLIRPETITLSPGKEYFDLSERMFDVLAVALVDNVTDPSSPKRYPLYKTGRADYDMMRGFGELTPGIPCGWSYDSDTMRLRIYPPAENTGQLEVLGCKIADDDLAPMSSERRLEVPPNLWWVIKYGVLADLLRRDGQAPDWVRAEYCQKRWEDGIRLAKLNIPTIVNARVNDKQVPQSNLLDEDAFASNWAQETGASNRIIVASWDLIAVVPIRATGAIESSVEFLVSQRVKLPEIGDLVDLPKDVIAAVLEYAKHIALFKISGAEFGGTMNAYPILFNYAAEYNSVLASNSRSFSFGADKAGEAKRKEFKAVEV